MFLRNFYVLSCVVFFRRTFNYFLIHSSQNKNQLTRCVVVASFPAPLARSCSLKFISLFRFYRECFFLCEKCSYNCSMTWKHMRLLFAELWLAGGKLSRACWFSILHHRVFRMCSYNEKRGRRKTEKLEAKLLSNIKNLIKYFQLFVQFSFDIRLYIGRCLICK